MIEHESTQQSYKIRIWRRIVGLAGIALLAALLLGLDLSQRGLVWRFFWEQTGEEAPIGQLRGMLELGGNWLRPQPQLAMLQPIAHSSDIPFGINTFLQAEVEEDKIRAMLAMIQDAGFVWLRQEFPWEDLEVDGRGQFTDTRNDYDGDGQPDTIDAWLKYDRIVDLVEDYDLRLMVRLSNPPEWSRAENPATAGGALAPPDDFDDFVNFAVAVATRYQGRISHYQIWNEPNIYPEWGEQFADPAAYTDMLCRTYRALKAVDPDIVVLSGAIAPTISLDGFAGYQDLIYLQKMYDAGAGDCFDILSAQGYGLFSGPTDRRLRLTAVNYARHVYYRDIMVANGDGHKGIWLAEAAWNAVEDAELPREEIADYSRFGTATQDQAARWMPIAYQRAAEEWPWISGISYWFFTRPNPFEQNQSFYYFRMVEPDYSPEKPSFTPLPVYETMRQYIAETTARPQLFIGTHQAEHWAIAHDGQLQPAEGAQFGEALRLQSAEFEIVGTHLEVRLRRNSEGDATLISGETQRSIEAAEGWQTLVLENPNPGQPMQVALRADAPMLFDAIRVIDRSDLQARPLIVLGLASLLVLAVLAWRWFFRGLG